MPRILRDVEPQIKIGDRVVQVGGPDYNGFTSIVKKIAGVNVNISALDLSMIEPMFQMSAADRGTVDLTGAIVGTFLANAEPILRAIASTPEIAREIAVRCSNVSDEEFGNLSAGEALAVSAASLEAAVASGVVEQAASFFGAALRLVMPKAKKAASPPPEPAAANP